MPKHKDITVQDLNLTPQEMETLRGGAVVALTPSDPDTVDGGSDRRENIRDGNRD